MRLRTLTIASLVFATAVANAQLVVANDTGTTTIYYIDVTTGAATALFTPSTDARLKAWGMAADEANQVLYWNNGGTLYRCSYADLRTGNLFGISQVTLNQVNGTTTSMNCVALAYDPINHKLQGTRNIAIEAVYDIDTTTGFSTPVYTYSSTYDMGGLDYDPGTGVLYGLSDTPTATRGLYSINVAGQSETFIAGYPINPATGLTDSDIDGLAVANGKAYYVTDGNSTTQPVFYVYDIASATMVSTIPSPFLTSGTFCAATWAPGIASTQVVSGTLNLGDTTSAFAFTRSMSYTVTQGSTTVASGSVACNAPTTTMSLNIPTSVTGAVTITFDGSSFLKRVLTANLTGSNQSIGSVTMQNGDVDGSGEVDAVDIDQVIADFGLTSNVNSDVDVSGEVDAVDIDIVIANFGGLDN